MPEANAVWVEARILNEPTVLDLFSGIGGFSLAFESVGFKTIGFAEIDPYASAVLRKHWPDVPNYGDVRTVPAVRCDVITGGFPCQPFSVAGKRRGKSDDRFLWPSMLDVIRRCQPAWVCGENVPGIVSMELEAVLSDLESIGFRTAPPLVIPACAAGSFQHRKRVWICAHAEREGRQRCKQVNGASSSQEQTYPELGDGMPASWDALAGHCRGLRGGDGLSCAMVRREVKAYGNAIVPQVAQVIARAIYQQLRP